ncbi:lipopolysaccharide export system protein LptA [Tepidamorphus gemmatus]|uniref:Lipopolysaccharide export system protein LptA n=1 Tax=Tepidamorphus gemmatus TaxID=747076 RepID=A0A4R3MGD2_9HYPH|nr:LptA/OstA family protein [Tepidamorphus gemmatus]TCT10695.1 lipopolysaccharide export system protein LptA [Tepidamorphus gemmatus]
MSSDTPRPRLRFARLAAAVLAVSFAMPEAHAQVSDAFSGLAVDSDTPVRIEADQLEVFDADKTAVFSGNVVVRQGDTSMRTAQLKVFYSGDGLVSEGASSGQRVSRLEATGKVLINAKGQTATGDWAVFEMDTQLVTLGGNVVLSQGKNVLRGTELVVNLETGQSRLVSAKPEGTGGGRVQGLLIPGSMGQKQERRQGDDNAGGTTN